MIHLVLLCSTTFLRSESEAAGMTVRLYLPRLIVAETGEGDCPPPHRIVARDWQ